MAKSKTLLCCIFHAFRAEECWLKSFAEHMDRLLLLAIQSACNQKRQELPWDLISQHLGNGATPGAITQHLSKIRSRFEQQGLPVPPPLRRGGMRSAATQNAPTDRTVNPSRKAKTAHTAKNRKTSESTEYEADVQVNPDDDYRPGTAQSRKRRRVEAKSIKQEDDTEAEDEEDTKIGVGSKFLSHVSPPASSKPSSSATLSESGSNEHLVCKFNTKANPKVAEYLGAETIALHPMQSGTAAFDHHSMPYYTGYPAVPVENPAQGGIPGSLFGSSEGVYGQIGASAGHFATDYHHYPTNTTAAPAFSFPPTTDSAPFLGGGLPMDGQYDGYSGSFDEQMEALAGSCDPMWGQTFGGKSFSHFHVLRRSPRLLRRKCPLARLS